MLRRVVVASLVLFVASVLVAPAGAQAATWDADVRIGYSAGCDVFVAHPSGSDKVNVTSGVAACASQPSISRTGRYVSYITGRTAFVYDAQTGTHSELAAASGGSAPHFSPSSDTLTFGRYSGGLFNLYSVGIDGTGLKNWTNETDEDRIHAVPRWSADGQSLLYATNQGARLCRMDRGGFDELYYADRIYRVTTGGTRTQVAGDDAHSTIGGMEAAGTLAYLQGVRPATGPDGYCVTDPDEQPYDLVVNGARVAGDVWGISPSVSDQGDVAYVTGADLWVHPAGGGPPELLVDNGLYPDWGVAYGGPTTDCTVEGDDENNRLVGTPGDDVICGYGGEDVLFGNGGNDVLRGGEGEDDLVGGPGLDRLDGGDHADALRGDEGNDVLDGGPGADLVTYFTIRSKVTVNLATRVATSVPHGRDTLVSVEGAFGSKTGDLLIGNAATNHLAGGPGNDVVKGGGRPDLLFGTAGTDVLLGGAAADTLYGDAGTDTLNGGAATDVCYDTSARRTSCELTEADDPRRGGQPPSDPGDADGFGEASAAPQRVAVPWTYALGNDDFLVVYDRATTQSLGSWANSSGWESQTCQLLRFTAVRGLCTAAGAYNSVQKYQMKWFLWNAKLNGGCAVGIADWGRHGVNQFKQRWKTRPATFYRYNVAIPWLTPGRYTDVKVGSSYIRITCS